MRKLGYLAATLVCVLMLDGLTQTLPPPPTQRTTDNQPLPALWELGVGAGAAITPNYPGADNTTSRALPLPVVIYRGDFFRIGDGSVASGHLFDNQRLELDISLNGSFDAESDDVAIRNGMPDLGFVAEVGPELEILLSDPKHTTRRWKLELPIRAAFSLDDRKLSARGYVFSPQLEFEQTYADGRYELSLSLTPSFASERLHEYFYDVAPQFATPSRPAFNADGGYMRTSIGVGLQQRSKKHFAALGINYNTLQGAANEDSPLFRQSSEFSIAAIIVFRLWESERRAPR